MYRVLTGDEKARLIQLLCRVKLHLKETGCLGEDGDLIDEFRSVISNLETLG